MKLSPTLLLTILLCMFCPSPLFAQIECVQTDCQNFDFTTCDGAQGSVPRLCTQACICGLSVQRVAFLDSLSPGALVAQRNGALVVTSVLPASPAQVAGLRAGDRITKFNGNFPMEVSCSKAAWNTAAQTASLEIERNGQRIALDLKLLTVRELLRAAWVQSTGGQAYQQASFTGVHSQHRGLELFGVGLELSADGTVIGTLRNSVAQVSGIRAGDRILDVDGITEARAVAAKLSDARPGDHLTLRVRRARRVSVVQIPVIGPVDMMRVIAEPAHGTPQLLAAEAYHGN